MTNKEMKTLAFGNVTYEVVDEKARRDLEYKIPNSEKGKANGVASLDKTGKVPKEQLPEPDGDANVQSDWNATEASSGAIKNKPPIKKGTGTDSVVIGIGNASGDYSVAGGTNDQNLIKKLTGSNQSVDKAKATGGMSVAFGANSEAITAGTGVIGFNSTAGCKGYYWWSIDFSTNTIQLSTSQKSLLNLTRDLPQKLSLVKGDTISIVNGDKHDLCSTILAVDTVNGTIQVDSLPFTEIETPLALAFDDYAITCPTKPLAGEVDLGYGAFAIGLNNKAVGSFSHVEGYNNIGAGKFSHAEGKGTVAGYASHAEGNKSRALGIYTHAEGYNTLAEGNMSHSEGCNTIAKGLFSHVEGRDTQATSHTAHAEGYGTHAEGSNSHAEGQNTIASGSKSHAEGYYTTASGANSHAEGYYTTASGEYSHAEGYYTTASGEYSHAEGYYTTASGEYSHAEGYYTTASGSKSHAEGTNTIASGSKSHAEGQSSQAIGLYAHSEGYYTTANGESSHAEGQHTTTEGTASHAEGASTTAGGLFSHAEGRETQATSHTAHAEGYGTHAEGSNSHAEGQNTIASGSKSHAEGFGTIAGGANSHVQGKHNIKDTENKYAHIIGYGSGDSESARANIHTVDWTGLGYFKSGTTTTGADYAEYFEWLDGNPDNEDRVGLLVTLDGDKIKLANTDDEVLGVISGTTAVLGDNYEFEWNGKYLTDNFGRVIYEDVEEFDEVIVGEDEDGNLIIEKVSLGFFKYPVLNPEYDPEQSYVNRADRPEWDTVGMLGKLYVRDDGTCQVNGYATVGENGIATASTEKTNMRVLSRVNENIVRVLLK